jgi:hypothetical protein
MSTVRAAICLMPPCITDFSAYFFQESQAVQQKSTQRAVTAAATTQSEGLFLFSGALHLK